MNPSVHPADLWAVHPIELAAIAATGAVAALGIVVYLWTAGASLLRAVEIHGLRVETHRLRIEYARRVAELTGQSIDADTDADTDTDTDTQEPRQPATPGTDAPAAPSAPSGGSASDRPLAGRISPPTASRAAA